MITWLDLAASNALAATVLAVFAWAVSRVCRRPQVVFAVWVLVLAKLVTPPLVSLPVESLRGRLDWTPAIASHEPTELPVDQLLGSDKLPSHLRLPSEPLASAGIADPMELLNGSLVLDEIAPLEESVAASPFDETEHALLDLVSTSEVAPAAAEPFTMPQLLLVVWLVGSSLWFALAAGRIVRFRRLLKLARPAAADLEAEVRTLAARMQLRQVPEVRIVRRRVSPLVWALGGRATLLLPSDLLRRLTRDERATLLAHELAHLKRRDHLVRLLELTALGLFWWHPVAWWARLNAERAAEHCCDAQVIELFPAQARAYALALWTTIDFLSDAPEALPLGASGFSQAGHVKRRMEMILANTRDRRAGRPLRFALVAIGLAVLPLSLRSLWAEPPAKAEVQEAQVEIILGGEDVALEAGTTGTVEIEEQRNESVEDVGDLDADFVTVEDSQPDPARRQAFNAQAAEEPSPKPAPKTSNIEERLDRLEKMIQALAERRPGPETTADAKPHVAATPKPRLKVITPRPYTALFDGAKSPDAVTYFEQDGIRYQRARQADPNRNKKDDSNGDIDVGSRLTDIVRDATMHLELSKTNYVRYEAARRQVEAIKKAYESGTVPLDQLLEAQRRVIESYVSYIRVTAELEPKALDRQLLFAKATLAATNDALHEAHETWKNSHQVATPGSAEEKSEAQAREQYFQFKMQAQKLLEEYQRAKEAYYGRKGLRTPSPTEGKATPRKEKSDMEARRKYAGEEIDKLAQDKLKMAADSAKHRLADAEKIQQRAKLEIEKAHREAEEVRRQLEAMEKHARVLEQEAQTAVKAAEAAAKQLEAIKAEEGAAKESTKPEATK